MDRRRLLSAVAGVALAGSMSFAQACDLPNPARASEVTVLANSFPVLQFLAEEMRGCTRGNLRVETRLTPEVTVQARTALAAGGTSPFAVVQVSNSTFTEFVNRGWLQPITDLVRANWDRYGFGDIPQALWDQVSFEGQIYSIPFQTNVQQLFYRKDVLDRLGIAVPRTWPEYVAAARAIRERDPSIEFPIAQTFSRGWNIATEFGNVYQSLGGTWLDARGMPTFNDERGVRAIELMRELVPFMSPNTFAFSNDDTMVAFQQGRSALGIVWASRAANMDAADVSRVRGQVQFAPAPAAGDAGPSTVLWWDGFVIPRTIGVDRELAFHVVAQATDRESMMKGGGVAYWSRQAVTSDARLVAENRYWPALTQSIAGGARIFPVRPQFSLAHTQVGANILDALQGRVSAKEALDRAAAAYVREARTQGLLQ
jgi:multiple sugar transport system substrate-binding protein